MLKLFGMLAFAFLVYNGFEQNKKYEYLQTHAYQTIAANNHVLGRLYAAESNCRGYIFTGDKRFVDKFDVDIEIVETNLNELLNLTKDDPEQYKHVATLKDLVNIKIGRLKYNHKCVEEGNPELSEEQVRSLIGKEIMDALRLESELIRDVELKSLEIQKKSLQESYESQALILNSFLTFGILYFVFRFLFFLKNKFNPSIATT